MGKADSATNVKVVVRCRPLNKKEKENQNTRIVEMDVTMGRVDIKRPGAPPDEAPKSFTFDSIFNWESTQRNVYDETAAPIVNSVLEGVIKSPAVLTLPGYNGTIFAYGQTGTGKTFTMEGVQESKELRGIIPNSFEHIFDSIALSKDREYLVRASYLEIYNEQIRDLLSSTPDQKLDLKEHPDSGVYVKDLSNFVVKNTLEIDQLMKDGAKNRSVGFTLMNAGSSRSHSIFTITIELSEMGPDGEPHVRAGKLNLVDLAGSERQGKTGAEGLRLVEATKINLSLTALGNVISALVDGKSQHIPYRDSKLTRLLQDSLGGNAKTVMVANLGPADYNYDETMSTLRYANRAKNIKNKPRINEDPKDAMIRQLQEELEVLKKQLGGAPGAGSPMIASRTTVIKKIAGNSGIDPALLDELKNKKESEIKAALAAKGIAEEETSRISKEMQELSLAAKREAEEKTAIFHKLELVKNKLLSGNLQDENAKQEAEIRKRAAELEKKAIEERRLQRELAEREVERNQKMEKFASLEQDVADKTKKLKKAFQTLEEAKKEVVDIAGENQAEREDLVNNIRELTLQLKLKSLIIDNFVPPEEMRLVEQRAEWNDEAESWILSHKRYAAGSNSKVKRPASAAGGGKRPSSEYARSNNGGAARYKSETLITFELDMPERTTFDYEGPSVEPRVQAALSAALAEEEDITLAAQDNLPGLLNRQVQMVKSRKRSNSTGAIKTRPAKEKESPPAASASRPASATNRKMTVGGGTPINPIVSIPVQEEFPAARGLVARNRLRKL